ncbi:hypothetical protein A9267_12915 [Shewanella sp. UCD-FRSSP16_17]|nr:hypothetical protein [Shewanella sp. MMG014]OBT06797.1 hypothetical protein A9267_12915 [Shewanella sp. UCD-FRSSP16_17]
MTKAAPNSAFVHLTHSLVIDSYQTSNISDRLISVSVYITSESSHRLTKWFIRSDVLNESSMLQ